MVAVLPFNDNVGETIPPNTQHAVSVSLPTWKANVGYEEGQAWVTSRMQTGYPRFFIHKSIDRLATTIAARYGSAEDCRAMLFPSSGAARRCLEFLRQQADTEKAPAMRLVDFVPCATSPTSHEQTKVSPKLSAVVFARELWHVAKMFWQHTGEGVSSRRAEFCERALHDGTMVESSTLKDAPCFKKGPRRYQRKVSITGQEDGVYHDGSGSNGQADAQDPSVFVEERFGRNLNIAFAQQAKLAIRRRIAGSLSADMDLHDALAQPEEVERPRADHNVSVDDVYLYANGMNSIYQTHRTMMLARGPKKSIMFGFPYVDTLKILEKFGPGALFYGHGSQEDLDDLEARLASGERYLALFCEFPGNPLLKSPDLKRIRRLANSYDFAVVIDETIGNFLNVHVLPDADVIVSSLTKVFSGDSNVMGGSAILNPTGRYYADLKRALAQEYHDGLFEEDAVFLERNSRDFVSRIARINTNAELICDTLAAHPRIKAVNYPKTSPTRTFYDAYKLPNGGYGGLLSCTFYSVQDAAAFYDALDTNKGPSLGTNFTLASPFVILAHYTELDWAARYGCEASLVRFSVGLEDPHRLREIFETALAAMSA